MPPSTNRRIVYRIEKFLPANCPKCDSFFRCENQDFILATPSKFSKTENICCQKCGNLSPKMMLETRTCLSRRRALKFVAKEGFVNLIKVPAGGIYARRDTHVTYYQKLPIFGSMFVVKADGHEVVADPLTK